jgi:hypothetical protein
MIAPEAGIRGLLEAARRRELALSGSSHLPTRTPAHAGPRPDAVSPLTAPELRWPSQQDKLPKRCTYCGSPGLSTDPPYGLVKFGETTCLLCSRVVVRWKADGTRSIRELAANLGVIGPAKRGRPPTPWTATLREKTQAPQRLCADNCGRPPRNGRLRCSSCQHKRADDQFHRVLVRVMTPGVPMPSWKIQALLGVQGYSIGRIVQRARLAGARITRVKHGWFRLEVP